MRDDTWLFAKMDRIWDEYFSDIAQENDVNIKFGRRARQRLGSIKQETRTILDLVDRYRKTIITINGLFRDPAIPEYVVEATIAHELCHYAHGFSSPIPRKFSSPHQGGVVTKEMRERGLEEILRKQKKWLNESWTDYVTNNIGPASRKRRIKKRRIIIRWI
jgi:predicted metal-dependent hydrolase